MGSKGRWGEEVCVCEGHGEIGVFFIIIKINQPSSHRKKKERERGESTTCVCVCVGVCCLAMKGNIDGGGGEQLLAHGT